MSRILSSTLILALLLVLTLAFVTSATQGASNGVCATPTPEGTITGDGDDGLNFSAVKSITLTTIYTVRNLENHPAEVLQKFLTTPDCSFAGNTRSDTIPMLSFKRIVLSELADFPDTFVGEIYLSSALNITETHENVSRITPTASPTPLPTFFGVRLPLIARMVPTATPTPNPANDVTAPNIVSWSLHPISVDTSVTEQGIIVAARLTDNASGLAGADSPTQARFRSPSGHQGIDVRFVNPDDLASGDERDGLYRIEMVVPRVSETGDWQLEYLVIEDKAGNKTTLNRSTMLDRGFPVSFRVTN